jgi:hypothetical protein
MKSNSLALLNDDASGLASELTAYPERRADRLKQTHRERAANCVIPAFFQL